MPHDKGETHVPMLALSGSEIEQVENEDQGHTMPDVSVDPIRREKCLVQQVDEQVDLDKTAWDTVNRHALQWEEECLQQRAGDLENHRCSKNGQERQGQDTDPVQGESHP